MSERRETKPAPTGPAANSEIAPFLAAAAEGRFLIRRCTACREAHWYPRAVCPFCGGAAVWEEASGQGEIYTLSVLRRGPGAPLAIGYVTLDEGPAMLTNFVGPDLDAFRIGSRVQVQFRPREDGLLLPVFGLAPAR